MDNGYTMNLANQSINQSINQSKHIYKTGCVHVSFSVQTVYRIVSYLYSAICRERIRGAYYGPSIISYSDWPTNDRVILNDEKLHTRMWKLLLILLLVSIGTNCVKLDAYEWLWSGKGACVCNDHTDTATAAPSHVAKCRAVNDVISRRVDRALNQRLGTTSERPSTSPYTYGVGRKVTPFWCLSFLSCYTNVMFTVFVCSRNISINWHRSLSADVNKFRFMRINCNFVTMVGLTNDGRCLIHHLHVQKHCMGFRQNYEKSVHINEHCEWLIANVKVV